MEKLNKYIDHTLLKAEAKKEDIVKLCQEALQHDFASVCVNPTWIETSYDLLKDSDVKVCTVIGFPLGANTTEAKAYETSDAINKGASEVDMVLNVGRLKSLDYDYVLNDVKDVVDTAKALNNDVVVKVILETCLLSKEEIVKACELCKEAGADFVKTSTGFSTGGARVEDVKLMKETVGDDLEVKASGGVKTPEQFEEMIQAGATRIGTSNGVALINGEKIDNNSY